MAPAIALNRVLSFRCSAAPVEGAFVLTAQIDKPDDNVLALRIPTVSIADPVSGAKSSSLTCEPHATALNAALASAKARSEKALDWWVVADVKKRTVAASFENGSFAIFGQVDGGAVDDMASELSRSFGFLGDSRIQSMETGQERKHLVHLGVTLLARSPGESAGVAAFADREMTGDPSSSAPATAPVGQMSGPAVPDSGSCKHVSGLSSAAEGSSNFTFSSPDKVKFGLDVSVPTGHSWSVKVDDRFEICGSGKSQKVEYTFVGDGRGTLPNRQNRKVSLTVRNFNGAEVSALGKSVTVCVGSGCPAQSGSAGSSGSSGSSGSGGF